MSTNSKIYITETRKQRKIYLKNNIKMSWLKYEQSDEYSVMKGTKIYYKKEYKNPQQKYATKQYDTEEE
jgi:hypothetical protein